MINWYYSCSHDVSDPHTHTLLFECFWDKQPLISAHDRCRSMSNRDSSKHFKTCFKTRSEKTSAVWGNESLSCGIIYSLWLIHFSALDEVEQRGAAALSLHDTRWVGPTKQPWRYHGYYRLCGPTALQSVLDDDTHADISDLRSATLHSFRGFVL